MAGCNEGIGVYETAGAGVIVAGLEVIEGGFGVVDIAAVAQGVGFAEGCRHGAGGISNIAPGIVGIFHDNGAAAVHDGNDIALDDNAESHQAGVNTLSVTALPCHLPHRGRVLHGYSFLIDPGERIVIRQHCIQIMLQDPISHCLFG